MKFSIGDKIVLKRTGDEGHIVAFISETMIEVEVGGTQFPVYADEVDHPYLKWFTEKRKEQKKLVKNEWPEEKIKTPPVRLAQGIYLNFLPVFKLDEMEDIVDHLKIFLINETPSNVRFNYEVKEANGTTLFRHEAQLHPFAHLYLHHLSLEEMNEQPRFHWWLMEALVSTKTAAQEGILRIRPTKLFEHISWLQLNNQPSFGYLLTENISIPATDKKETLMLPQLRFNPVPTLQKFKTSWQPKREIDLHIEQLSTDYEAMSSGEMLQLQLDTVRYYLDMAVAHKQDKMMIIHGIGKGVLRTQLHHILEEMKGIAHYKNEWHGKYGFGATEVIFER